MFLGTGRGMVLIPLRTRGRNIHSNWGAGRNGRDETRVRRGAICDARRSEAIRAADLDDFWRILRGVPRSTSLLLAGRCLSWIRSLGPRGRCACDVVFADILCSDPAFLSLPRQLTGSSSRLPVARGTMCADSPSTAPEPLTCKCQACGATAQVTLERDHLVFYSCKGCGVRGAYSVPREAR